MILKYLKLRTVRILRDKYLKRWSCVAVKEIKFGMTKWYRKQVKDYVASLKLNPSFQFLNESVPFFALSLRNDTEVFEERKIFLDWLEQEVIAGRK